MEEKDVKFDFVIEDLGERKVVNITSDIDECLDYLEIEERTVLLVEIFSHLVKQVLDKHLGEHEDLDGEEQVTEGVNDSIYYFIELLKTAVNIVNMNLKILYQEVEDEDDEEPDDDTDLLDISLVTYKPNKELGIGKIPFNSYHSTQVSAVDPLHACYDFVRDTAVCLMENDVPKSEVKEVITKSLKYLVEDMWDFIDKFEIE